MFISSLLLASLSLSVCSISTNIFYVNERNELLIGESANLEVHSLIDSGHIQRYASVTVLTHGMGSTFDDWLINNDMKNIFLDSESFVDVSYRVSNNYSVCENSIIDQIQHSNYRVDPITDQYLPNEFNMYLFGEKMNDNEISYFYCSKFNEVSNNLFILDNDAFSDVDITKNIILIYDNDNQNPNYQEVGVSNTYTKFKRCLNTVLINIANKQGGVLPKINLIGHSKGGLINTEYAIEFPELVQTFFTLGSPLGNLSYGSSLSSLLEILRTYGNAETSFNFDIYLDLLDGNQQYNRCLRFNNVCEVFYSRAFYFSQTLEYFFTSLSELFDYIEFQMDLNINLNQYLYTLENNFDSLINFVQGPYYESAVNLLRRILGDFSTDGLFTSLINFLSDVLTLLADNYCSYSTMANDGILKFDTLVNSSSAIGFCVDINQQPMIMNYNFNNQYQSIVGSSIGGDPFSIDAIGRYDMPAIAHNLETKSWMAASIIRGDLIQNGGIHNHSFSSRYSENCHYRYCLCGAFYEIEDHNLTLNNYDDINHKYTCEHCGYFYLENHEFEYNNISEVMHTAACVTCGEFILDGHNGSVYINNSLTKHKIYCLCGQYIGMENHQYLCNSLTCTKCGAVNGIDDGIFFPPIIFLGDNYEVDE